MDPTSKWILRPAGVCILGTLVVGCALSAAGGALAGSGQAIPLPDAPPSGAVISPTPDQPAATGAPAGAKSNAVRAPAAAPRPAVAPSGPSHPAARPGARPQQEPRQAAATKPTVRSSPPRLSAAKAKTIVLPRQRGLPDSVSAFLGTPITRVTEGGPDRGLTALAGTFLALVALGSGCLTVAVSRVAREH